MRPLEWILARGVIEMAKKKAAKRTTKKTAPARKRAAKPGGEPAPQDPIAGALARRRLAMIRH
jgi:hypothetical protein